MTRWKSRPFSYDKKEKKERLTLRSEAFLGRLDTTLNKTLDVL